MRLPFSAHVLLYRRTEKGDVEFLLLKRNARPDLGLTAFWQGVSGALEPGESFSQAAMREVSEETGLIVQQVVPCHFVCTFPIRDEWRSLYGEGPSQIEERTFVAEVDRDASPSLSNEHRECGWFGVNAARSLLTFGDTRAALDAAVAAIENKAASQLVFRDQRPEDVEALLALRSTTRDNAIKRARLAELGITNESMIEAIKDVGYRCIVCEFDGEPVGFCAGYATTGEVYVLAVHRDYDGRGIGTKLLSLMVAWLQSHQPSRIWLAASARKSNRSHAFYRRLGWQPSGERLANGDEILVLDRH